MPIMYHPADGRAVDIPQIAVTAALRDGFTMVPPSRPLDFEPPMNEAFPEGGSAANIFVRLLERFFAPNVAAAIMASPGGVRPDLVNIAERRASGEFLIPGGDIPVPDFSAVTGVQGASAPASEGRLSFADRYPHTGADRLFTGFSGPVPDKTISEIGEKVVRDRAARERAARREGLPGLAFTGIERPDLWPALTGGAGGLTPTQILELRIACNEGNDAACQILDELEGGGTGGGRGGGGGRVEAIEPEWEPPDERQVADIVEALLTALIGSADDSQKYVDIYMKEDKRRWEGAAEDPGQSVLEAIRDTEAYKRIHKNRPDWIKEGDWIGRQIVNLERQGLRASDIQQRAIDLATTGATPTERDASVAQVQATGQFTPEFMRRISDAATTIAGTI